MPTGAERIIAGYLDQLTEQPVFNRYEAERYLLLASDLPGYNVRLALRPAGGRARRRDRRRHGSAHARLCRFQRRRMAARRSLAAGAGCFAAQLFGLTGLGDRTTLSVFSTSDFHEQQTVQLGHDFHVGPEGLSIAGTFTYAWARPDIPDADSAGQAPCSARSRSAIPSSAARPRPSAARSAWITSTNMSAQQAAA